MKKKGGGWKKNERKVREKLNEKKATPILLPSPPEATGTVLVP